MGIVTKAQLTNTTETRLGARSFSDILYEAKSQNKYSAKVSIFLSHSHADLADKTLNKAIVFFRKLGILIYIDSNDSTLPPTTNADTASEIKSRIKDCDKFILLATNNSISSKWCNWELGFGDAHKFIDKIALFPIAENDGCWNGIEYLRIYPRIEESDYINEYYKVIYPNGVDISLNDWLKI
ncbi:MAG: toll/interleukin-1 receptor domain-containing protein [Ginsengibacter sp.]